MGILVWLTRNLKDSKDNRTAHYSSSERFNFCLAPWRIVSTHTVR